MSSLSQAAIQGTIGHQTLPHTLGELRNHPLYGEARLRDRTVKDEMRETTSSCWGCVDRRRAASCGR